MGTIPTAVVVRAETPADHEQVHDVVARAFGQPDEALLVRRLREAGDYVDELARVAVVGDRVVGHIAYSAVTIQPSGEHALSLAPVSVVPELQGSGIGGRLIEDSLRAAADQGHRLVVLLGHSEYYPRFGFEPAGPHGVEAPWDVPADAWMLRVLVPGASPTPGVVAYSSAFDA